MEDSRLFLIQYLPAEAPAVYRVTGADLADGDVCEVHGLFKTPPERMPGIRLRQVFDRTTSQLYTLYTTEPRDAAQDYGGWDYGGRDETFVHVLNLQRGWAYCAGLPRRFWGEPAAAQAIAPSPDGSELYIVDSMRGAVAVMNTQTLQIERLEKVDVLVPRWRAHVGAGERGWPDALRRLGRGRSRRLRDRHGDAPGSRTVGR